MIIDIHTHLINKYFNINNCKHNFATRLYAYAMKTANFEEYYQKMANELETSPVDKAVLCAIENSELCANNEQILSICKKNKNFLFGANLNPDDKFTENNLKTVIDNGAVLIKLLPSYQNLDLSDSKYINFFEMLKDKNIPLLVHTGIEHTIKSGRQEYNNPDRLENALKTGVNVICAHCGTKLNFWETDYFENFCRLANKYENCYGDISAMIPFYRMKYLKKISKNELLQSKLIFGTDYPSFPYLNLKRYDNNIFNSWYKLFEDLNFNETVFTNAEKLIFLHDKPSERVFAAERNTNINH